MDKPDVDSIEGLSPAISIDQKTTSRNPRSTVGTVTEIYDYLRLLWARIGHPALPSAASRSQGQSAEQIIDQVMELPEGERFMVLAPVVRGRKGEYGKALKNLLAEGFQRAKVDGELRGLDEEIVLDKKFKHDISVVVDRLVMREGIRKRLADSIETAVALADGMIEIEIVPREGAGPGKVTLYSEKFACIDHGPVIPELEPRIFSFNSPHGACERCTGLGSQMEIDPIMVVPDPSLSLGEGAIAPWANSASNYYEQITEAIADKYGVDMETPWGQLSAEHQDLFLTGTNGDRVEVSYRNRYGRRRSYSTRFEGIISNLERRYRETDSEGVREKIEEYMSLVPCPVCKGARLRPESRAVKVGGIAIHEFCAMSVRRALGWLDEVELTETERHIARLIFREIQERLQFLENVGIGYLSMERAAATLSGRRGAADSAGDADRLRAGRRVVRVGRAVDRAASARQHQVDRDAGAAAGSRQHGAGRRARRADDARGRPSDRHRAGRRRARRQDRRPGHGQAGHEGQVVADGSVPGGDADDRGAGQATGRRAATSRSGRVAAQPQEGRRQGAARRHRRW